MLHDFSVTQTPDLTNTLEIMTLLSWSVSQVLDFAGISGLKALRVLRVLRPLRLLNKIKSLQLMIMAIWSSATDIMNVLFLWAFGYIAFAVVGIYLFGGKLYSCSDSGFVGPPLNPDQPPGMMTFSITLVSISPSANFCWLARVVKFCVEKERFQIQKVESFELMML